MKTLVIVVGVLAVGACGSKRDCDAYTRHYASLSESTRASTSDTVRDMCEKGEVSDSEYKCVMEAKTHDDIRACMGLTKH